MYIHNSNLTIRDATADDAEQLAEWWNDGEVMAHAGFPLGLGTTAEKIAESLAQDRDDTRRRLIIEVDSVRIGEMSYRRVDDTCLSENLRSEIPPFDKSQSLSDVCPTAEIGIKICDPAYQNRGFGKKLLCMLICELFRVGYQKIILDTNLNNTRAQHVYEQLGFRRIRVNIDSWHDQLKRPQSSVDYELCPSDFAGIISDISRANRKSAKST